MSKYDLDNARVYAESANGEHEDWFNLSDFSDNDELIGAITEDFDGDEFTITDSEDVPVELVESDSVSDDFWTLKDHENSEAVMAYMKYHGLDVSDALEQFDEAFQGEYNSEEEFSEEMYKELEGEIPSILDGCIDWDAVWKSYYRHDYTFVDGYVFDDNVR